MLLAPRERGGITPKLEEKNRMRVPITGTRVPKRLLGKLMICNRMLDIAMLRRQVRDAVRRPAQRLAYENTMRRDSIDTSHFSTSELPPDDRYDAWLNWGWPRIATIFRTDPTEPFDTTWHSALLGEVVFVRTRITGMRYERRVQDVRQSDFDSLIVNMMIEGAAHGVFGDREFHQPAGHFHFHDISKPSTHVSSSSFTYSLIIPRPLSLESFTSVDDLHGLVIGSPCAGLLHTHAERVWQALPSLGQSSAASLGRSFIDLLAVAVSEARAEAPLPSAAASRLRQRAVALIETCLNTRLTPDHLCARLKVSRKALFAAFREDGGVDRYIRSTRLERAKTALADVARREPIGMIAGRLGFYDASHMSRLFRDRYGMTPRDYRDSIARGRNAIDHRGRGGEDGTAAHQEA